MGSYTPIVTSAATVTARRRRLRVDSAHGKAEREESTFAFACPECGEGSAVETECPRCDVALRPTATSVQLPRRAHARSAVGYSAGNFLVPVAGVLGMFGLGGLFVLGADGSIDPQLAFRAMLALLGLLLLLGSPVALSNLVSRVRSRRAWARLRSRAEARVARAGTRAPSDADESPDPLRITGTVRITDGEVRVCDERTGVRVPLTPQVRVLGADGERFVLTDGEEVDAVGYGVRRLGAGEAYRDTRGELELDGSRPVELWIRS